VIKSTYVQPKIFLPQNTFRKTSEKQPSGMKPLLQKQLQFQESKQVKPKTKIYMMHNDLNSVTK